MKLFVAFLLICVQCSYSRIHKLQIKGDGRRYIALNTFGFYQGGILDVKLMDFQAHTEGASSVVMGFSLDKTLSDSMNPYLDSHQDRCILETPIEQNTNGAAVYFIMDFKNKMLRVNCTGNLAAVHILHEPPGLGAKPQAALSKMSNPYLLQTRRRRDSTAVLTKAVSAVSAIGKSSRCPNLPMAVTAKPTGLLASTQFQLFITTPTEEGLYSLYFHNCDNYRRDHNLKVDFEVEIKETNMDNYLSAGEMPLPALYFMMALLFFLSGCFWVFILSKSKHPVFKIHYLMALLVYLKSLSLLFHGINFHFIETKGEHIAAWAILFYVTHLLKGAVLFIVIVLVGTGWTFIKHILSEKDKKIFMIVIPLQVLANVAKIIIEESEEGDAEYRTWTNIFTLVDLLCCGAILFPVVWSIRHLQEASQTDGKAAINLHKLKLFRHFYIMIVCYIYFTRIIAYLLKITVPFQYEWLDEMFREMATYVFFVLTGYKFRPASANPYFQLPAEEDEEEMDIVVTETGLTEGLKKVNRIESGRDRDGGEEDKESLISKRESSHEYD